MIVADRTLFIIGLAAVVDVVGVAVVAVDAVEGLFIFTFKGHGAFR